MMRALFWKEYREQRLPALVLLSLGTLILSVVLTIFEGGQRNNEMRVVLALVFAGACGMVTGAILLANEVETGTLALLDSQPAWRRQIWFVKGAFAVSVTTFQALVLAAVCVPFVDSSDLLAAAVWLSLGTVLCGLFGLGCGLLGSTFGHSVLGAIGFAVVALFGSALVWLLLRGVVVLVSSVLFDDYGQAHYDDGFNLAAFVLLIPLPAMLSLLIYGRQDASRRLAARYLPLAARVGRISGAWGLRSLLWLSARRSRVGMIVGCVLALIAGQVLLVEPLVLWPLFTLVIGLVHGVNTLADEQTQGTFRLLGDQRLPVGRFWAVKVLWRFGLALLFCALMLISAGLFVELMTTMFVGNNSGSFNSLWEQRFGFDGDLLRAVGPGPYLTMWVVYGFCFGQMASLLFRKTLVALFLGFGASLIAVSVWIPSLISGGMPTWHMFVIPGALLVCSRLLLWAWATDRLMAKRVLTAVCAVGVIALFWIVGVMCFRVIEAPPVTPRIHVNEYLGNLPDMKEDPARSVLQQAATAAASASSYAGFNDGPDLQLRRKDAIAGVIALGWKEPNPALQKLLEESTRGEWPELMRTAAQQPTSMFTDPRLIAPGGRSTQSYVLLSVSEILAVRALRDSSLGHHAKALETLLDLLTIARHLQNRSLFMECVNGHQLEILACEALCQWAQHPQLTAPLLKKALEALQVHERLRPSVSDNVRSEFVLARGRLERPRLALDEYGRNRAQDDPFALHWRDAVLTAAVITPWEKARRERLLHTIFGLLLDAQQADYPTLQKRARESEAFTASVLLESPALRVLPPALHSEHDRQRVTAAQLVDRDLFLRSALPVITPFETSRFLALTHVRAAQIRLALTLYQHRHVRPADKLDQLIPEYFAAVPIDPYAERPFSYRVSAGETLHWPTQSTAEEESGQWESAGTGDGGGGMPAGGAADAPAIIAPGDAAGPLPAMAPNAPQQPHAAGTSTRRKIRPGAGIVWSVGPNGRDDHGLVQFSTRSGRPVRYDGAQDADLIFLVPRWQPSKKD